MACRAAAGSRAEIASATAMWPSRVTGSFRILHPELEGYPKHGQDNLAHLPHDLVLRCVEQRHVEAAVGVEKRLQVVLLGMHRKGGREDRLDLRLGCPLSSERGGWGFHDRPKLRRLALQRTKTKKTAKAARRATAACRRPY
jgi:hypothetical protein